MLNRVAWVAAIFWLSWLTPAAAEVGGRLQQELAVRVADRPVVSQGLSFLQLEGSELVGARGRLTVVGRFFYDGVLDRANPARLSPGLAADDPVTDRFFGAELKEAYLDLMGDTVDLRIGRQIVRWGLLEGARITDRVNPLDFQEFLFRDLEDRYIPLWMVRADYYPSWGKVQWLAIPELRFHRPAPAGSEWVEFELPPDLVRPSRALQNTEWGVKADWRLGDADISASYFYTWDDFPAAFRSVFGVGGQLTGVDFNARYERLQVLGLSWSRSLWESVVSLEGSYDIGKRLATDAGAGISGNEISRDVLRLGAGLDLNLGGVDVSLLYFQEEVIGWHDFIPVRRLEQAASMMVREMYFNDRLAVQLLVLYFHTGHQRIIRPKVEYKLTDHIKCTLGLDVLAGERGSPPDLAGSARNFRFVGFFKDHDRVKATVSYRF